MRKKVWKTSAISAIDEDNNPNWVKIEAIIHGDIGGFTVREIGVFDDKGDILP